MKSRSPPYAALSGSTGTDPVCRDADTDGAAERRERHLGMLAELAEIGMDLARDVRRRALEAAETVSGDADTAPQDGIAVQGSAVNPRADWGLVFARIARAVRQTVALEARLAADAENTRAQRGAAAEGRLVAAERVRSKQQKDRVRRLVEGMIVSEAEGHRAENLRLDLDERLEDPDIEAELGWRPIGVIVAAICEDLGIKADLRQFTDAELGMDLSMCPAAMPSTDADRPDPGEAREARAIPAGPRRPP